MPFPFPVVQSVLLQSPLHLIWVAGIAMAWMHREEQPQVSWLVCISLMLLLLDATAGVYLHIWLPNWLPQQESSSMPMLIIRNLVANGSLRLVVQMVAWSLLLFPTFNWRHNR